MFPSDPYNARYHSKKVPCRSVRLLAMGLVFLPAALPIMPPLLQDATTALAQEDAVNGHLNLHMARFEQYEVELEQQFSDTLRTITTTRYDLTSPAGAEAIITRVVDFEVFNWSNDYPKKVRHFTLRAVARAAGLEPVRTDVVDQVWQDVEAAWETTRWHTVYEPGLVQSYQSTGDTVRLELPDGILQGEMMSLAFGLHADLDPPSELLITYHDRATNTVAERRYAIRGRTSQTAAGHMFEAFQVRVVDSTNPDAATYGLYAAEMPRFYLGSFDQDPPSVLTRLRRGVPGEVP